MQRNAVNGNDTQIMGNQDDRRFKIFLEFEHDIEDLCLDRDVQGRGRFTDDAQDMAFFTSSVRSSTAFATSSPV